MSVDVEGLVQIVYILIIFLAPAIINWYRQTYLKKNKKGQNPEAKRPSRQLDEDGMMGMNPVPHQKKKDAVKPKPSRKKDPMLRFEEYIKNELGIELEREEKPGPKPAPVQKQVLTPTPQPKPHQETFIQKQKVTTQRSDIMPIETNIKSRRKHSSLREKIIWREILGPPKAKTMTMRS